ncbi:MAG: ribose-phosphate pyrophosphokinase [Elusimicrobia bacterium]|nr:ribose-phosphate pyrophosphokinase [Elusimicrobiota bacterium]
MAVAERIRKAPEPKRAARPNKGDNLLLFSGTANPALAQEIGNYLGRSLGRISLSRFADGEVNVQIEENVRGKDCFVIQPTCRPPNENLVELLLILDTLHRASAGKITAVVPYFGYARADRKTAPRVPISAKLCANLIVAAGAMRVITIDLHAGQIQGFFDIPLDHLFATKVFLNYVKSRRLSNVVVVSPDVGGVERARAFAKRIDSAVAFVDKRRPVPNQAHVFNVVGDVEGKTALVIDDIVDTAGTLSEVARALKRLGAAKVYVLATHGVLSGNAIANVEAVPIEELVITNSIPLTNAARNCRKIRVLSIAPLLGEAILRNHQGESISALFK